MAGFVAAIALACGEAAKDAAGDMMRDAGDAIADAGESMRDAGMSMLADAATGTGHALRDAGTAVMDAGHGAHSKDGGGAHSTDSGSGDAHAQEASGDGLPRPHWILKDKDGNPVQADVYPGYSARVTKFSEIAPECVSVSYIGKRSVGLGYLLATGTLAVQSDCVYGVANYATWRDGPYRIFADAACQGDPYYLGVLSGVKIGGTFYYADGDPSIVKAATYYQWNTTSSTCVAVSPANGQDLWMLKPVPADIVSLLPDAPYSMELVY